MIVAVVYSLKDAAGVNIASSIQAMRPFSETEQSYDGLPIKECGDIRLVSADKESINCERIDEDVAGDIFIFATKHQSKSGVRSLSVHAPGNWGSADLGGETRKLCTSLPCLMKESVRVITKLSEGMGFDVILECTHHGPYLEKPVMFIEIGSSHEQWIRSDAADVIAKTIFHICDNVDAIITKWQAAIGIGGLHHTPNFFNIIQNSEIAVGHVCPKYRMDDIDDKMIQQAMQSSYPKATLAILDWKGLAGKKDEVVFFLEKLGVSWKKTKEFSHD